MSADETIPPPLDAPKPPPRLHLTITRAEGVGWIVYATGTQHLIGRFVSATEAIRHVCTRRWRYGVDVLVLDDDGETIRTFTVELPKRAITKGGVRVA